MANETPHNLPTVAVVTPVYNGEAFLAETMQAVQALDYPNLVHVILDNASTDATPSIIARYTNCRVPLLTKRNAKLLPMNKNWNTATKLVPQTADYFCMLSADDLYAPSFISKAVNLLTRMPNLGAVGCLYHTYNGPTVQMGWPADRETIPGTEALKLYFEGGCRLPAPHAMYRRTELDYHKRFFFETANETVSAADLFATMQVLTHSDLGLIHEDLATTRLHPDNQTTQLLYKDKRYCYEYYLLLTHFGPITLGDEPARRKMRLFQRHYLRQLIKWRFDSRRPRYDIHMRALTELGLRPSLYQYADAFIDAIRVKSGRGEIWQGWPFNSDI